MILHYKVMIYTLIYYNLTTNSLKDFYTFTSKKIVIQQIFNLNPPSNIYKKFMMTQHSKNRL